MNRPVLKLQPVEVTAPRRTGDELCQGRKLPAAKTRGARTRRAGGSWVRPAIGFLVFVEILLLGGHSVRWARTSPRFALSEVVVEGHRALDARDLVRLTALPAGLNIFDVDLEQVRERVAANPWVRKASVRRQLPHALRVEIEERRPAALLRRDPPFGVDVEGAVLGPLLEKPAVCLPLIEGFNTQRLSPGASVWAPEFEAQLAAVTLLAQTPILREGCLSVRRMGEGRLLLQALGGKVVLLASVEGFETQAARLRAVVQDILRKPPASPRIELDLTFPGRVVVRPIEQDGGAKG